MTSSVGGQVEDYLRHLVVERGLSDNTVQAYRRDLLRYQEYLGSRGIGSLAEVTRVDVEEFRRHLDHIGLAPASVTRCVVAVRNLHRFAVGSGQVQADVTAGMSPGTRSRRLPKALTMDQVESLLAAPDTSTVEGLRDVALLELLYGTGARVSEVCALDVDDIRRVLDDPDLGLRLIGKGDKERIVPLGSYAAKAVDAWLIRGRPAWAEIGNGEHALLLNTRGRRLSRQSAWAVIRRAGEAAGLDVEHLSPHSLRHSYATHLLDGGADVRVVQELLGHSSVTTTQIYTLVTADHLREVYRSSHPRAV
ncbi:site-specific tyrosine recombinase XerD [Cutibacterium acnes]|uniref:site-specific tyrosine recombinase XerD n=1 Tax=Cutibacterium acnes TaxID=1747 RepID=UPI0001F09A15|nr:site-specific tyrosine recombinase XerD [Cutibacterium acnes]EFT64720.1 tyrosine recombinase XerD [Cutibacterium acnes HL060PA1]MCK6133846.1 site-specific tyrosine recombinase XerD [Cutibacterium acnes]MCM8849733.1 site-specific tyrosine recombinase XerD [Cutibacterium acnes]PGF55419.1 site-specific tyrosine recombinase XerD [Cutibacterium acnes subsp. defendens]REB49394.1 site-specific tyrosine recombinase XerD [Cutibacterium acnes]